MGRVLKAKEGDKIKVKGLDLELESVYLEVRYTREINGEAEIQGNIYANELAVENPNNTLSVVVVDTETEQTAEIPAMGNYGKFTFTEEKLEHKQALDFVCDKLSKVLIQN